MLTLFSWSNLYDSRFRPVYGAFGPAVRNHQFKIKKFFKSYVEPLADELAKNLLCLTRNLLEVADAMQE